MVRLRHLFIWSLVHAAAVGAPPANDSFASRGLLTTGVAATATTADASLEAAEQRPFWLEASRYRRSVWWKWTAPSSGWYQATTSGSVPDTVLTVNTGNSLNSLTLVQANDNDLRPNLGLTSEYLVGPALPSARVLFEAAAGTEYQIAVASGELDAGPVRVKVEPFRAPSPLVTAFTITPSVVDANAPSPRATATLSIRTATPFLRGTLYLYNRSNGYQARAGTFTPSLRISGNELNGTYAMVVNPHVRSPAGTVDMQLILEADGDSEISSYGIRGHSPMPLGATASFPMVNSGSVDSTAPLIMSGDISPASHDVSTSTKSSTATFRVTDDLSGVKILLVSLIDETGREFYRAAQSFRTSGTSTDGIYTLSLDFPYYWRVGSYTIRAWAEDFAGNVGAPLGPGQAGWPGPFTGSISVTRSNTVTMSSVTVTPASVDVSLGPQTVTIEANVAPASGFNLLNATFSLWPGMVGEPYFTNYAPEISVTSATSAVTRTATGWKATIIIPQGYPPGLAPIGIQCVAGNTATYFGNRFNVSFPVGPPGVVVVNDGDADVRPPRVEYLDVNPDPMVRTGCPGDVTRCTLRLTDDASGIPGTDAVSTGLRTANFSTTGWPTAVGSADRISGTSLDGVYTFGVRVENAFQSPLSAGDYVLQTILSDRVGRKATITRTRAFKLVSAPAAWLSWIDGAFGGASANCELKQFWGPYSDPDGDGVGNLLEGYFNTDPNQARGLPAPVTPGVTAGDPDFTVSWIEPQTANGLTVIPQWSPDLIAWLPSGEAVRGTSARSLTIETLGSAAGGVKKQVRMNRGSGSGAWLRLLAVPLQ